MGNCGGLSRFLEVQRIICIDDSYAKCISPVVQIYLAVLAIANSFTENCVWLRVAWHELNEHETELNNKTECRIFPYKRVSLKKYSYCDSVKNVAWIFLHEMLKGRTFSEVIRTWKFMQLMCNVNWRLIGLSVVLPKQLYHDSFRLSQKRLFALQRRYDSWKGFKINTAKMFSCMIHSDRPQAVNKLPTISASMWSIDI